MYGGGKLAEHPSDAAEFMAEATADAAVMEARFRAGLALLHAQPDVDAAAPARSATAWVARCA